MAGVVGLGGAAFPSDIKLRIGKQKITTLILNGAECEPYITCDDMLMRERAAEIVQGAEILRFMLDANEVLIGVEDNKPAAIAALQQAIADSGPVLQQNKRQEVVAIPTIYPGGSAKQLIRVLTGLEVPSGKLPTDIGVQCFNVATAYTVHRALAHGEPLLSRIVTITGNVREARNYEALIGTPIAELLALSDALPDTNGYIMGGPMMGFALPAPHVPMVKATNCIIAASAKLFPRLRPPCRASAARAASKCARRICSRRTCTGSRNPGNSAGRRRSACSTASNAARAAMSARATSRWCSFTVLPRARSARASTTSSLRTRQGYGMNSMNSASNARSGKKPRSSPPRKKPHKPPSLPAPRR